MDISRTNPEAQSFSHINNGRRSCSSDPTSPEFEFWMVRNPSFPQPTLLSADELFVDGVLLPLHSLPHYPPSDPPDPKPSSEPERPLSESTIPEPEPEPRGGTELSPLITDSAPVSTASKRWTDIFKMGEKKNASSKLDDREKEKKKERKRGANSGSAELNINIWPFSRSRSAGNAYNKPKFPSASAPRKVNSAPCSRSNSAGESKSRKWPSSPARTGVHLGRSSPVWQVKRGSSGSKSSVPVVRNAEKGTNKVGSESHRSAVPPASKAKVMSLNVPICMGYRPHLSCKSDENRVIPTVACGGSNSKSNSGSDGGSMAAGNVTNGGNLFNLRSLFTKKVH